MRNKLLLLLFLLGLSAAVDAKGGSSIVGRWVYQQGNATSEIVLDASGNGSFDGTPLRYQVQGAQLFVSINGGVQAYFYELKQNHLVIGGGDLAAPVQFTRETKAKRPQKSSPSNTGNDEALKHLLLANDWCSFSYSGGGGGYGSSGSYGHSSTSRVHLSSDGTISRRSGSENYSNNSNGSLASQGNSGDGGRWQVRGGVLYLSSGNAPLQPVNLSITRNSNGYPILKADGVEYMQCGN
jgi:hypothetical protein